MKIYVAMYAGELCKRIIRQTAMDLGDRPKIIIIDTLYDNGAIETKNYLDPYFTCRIDGTTSMNFDDILNLVCKVCIDETLNHRIQGNKEDPDFYFEIDGLNNIQSGIMFTAASRTGATVTYMDEMKNVREFVKFKPLPDVSRTKFYAWKALDTLYLEGSMPYEDISVRMYEDQVAGMDIEERKEFFTTHHNTYKVLDMLCRKNWIKIDMKSKNYSITPEGMTARSMMEMRDWMKENKNNA